MKLVDTVEEQEVLETLLDVTKPPVPPECDHLDYLLFTPFRYGAPYPTGRGFVGRGLRRAVFYASETVAGAVAEMAFHRLLFFADSPATPWPVNAGEYTAFSVPYQDRCGAGSHAQPARARPRALDRPRRLRGVPAACRRRALSGDGGDALRIGARHGDPARREHRHSHLPCVRGAQACLAPDMAHPSGSTRRPGNVRLSRAAARFRPPRVCRDPRVANFRWERT